MVNVCFWDTVNIKDKTNHSSSIINLIHKKNLINLIKSKNLIKIVEPRKAHVLNWKVNPH